VAARGLGTLTLDLIARIGGFKKGMDEAARVADNRAKAIEKSFKGLQGSLARFATFIGAGLLVRGIVENTKTAEEAVGQLNAVLKSTGGAVGFTSEQIQEQATALQRVTAYGDEAILSAQNVILTFTQVKGDNFEGATEAVLDMATALKTDLKSAAILVGKALNDPVKGATALSRSGVILTDSQKSLIKQLVATNRVAEAQKIILDELGVEFGGSARAARETFGGALEAVKNAFGDLLEADGGVNDTVGALNELADVLSDPTVVEGARTLANAIIQAFGKVASTVSTVVGTFKFLGEEAAARIYGPAADDVVRISEELATAMEARKNVVAGRIRFFSDQGIVSWWSEEELDAKIKELKQKLEDAYQLAAPPVPGTTTTEGGVAPPPPPSEDFVKMEEALKKQIALYGKVGEAAKIAAQIQLGELDGMTEAEQQQILALARRYDAIVKTAEAAKELEAANKKLQESYKSQEESFSAQIALENYKLEIGAVEELTQAQQIHFEVTYGSLQNLSPEQKARLEELGAELDAVTALTDAERERFEQQESLVQKSIELHKEARSEEDKLADRLLEIKEAYEAAGSVLTAEDVVVLSQEAVDAYEKATEQVNEFAKTASENVQNIIEDFLVNPMEEGFDGLLASFIQMLHQMAAAALAAKIAEAIFGSGGVGSGGGWVGALMGAFAGGAEEGGHFTPGKWGIAGEAGPELIFGGSPAAAMGTFDYLSRVKSDLSGFDLPDTAVVKVIADLSKFTTPQRVAFGAAPRPGEWSVVGASGPAIVDSGTSGATIISNEESAQLIRELVAFIATNRQMFKGLSMLANPFVLPSRDVGGRGVPGQPYMIGTGAQPEIFIPDSPGSFVPNNMNSNVTVRPQIVNVRDPSEIPTALRSSAGEQAILNVISRNPSAIKSMLGGQ